MMRTQLHCTLGSTCYPKRVKTLDVGIGSASLNLTRHSVFTDQFGDMANSTPPPAAQPNGLTVEARGVIKGGAVTANFTF